MNRREWFGLVCALVGFVLSAMLVWDLITPESWAKTGLPETLDSVIGFSMGVLLGWGISKERQPS